MKPLNQEYLDELALIQTDIQASEILVKYLDEEEEEDVILQLDGEMEFDLDEENAETEENDEESEESKRDKQFMQQDFILSVL